MTTKSDLDAKQVWFYAAVVAERTALRIENERLQARLAESEAENDQWQRKLAEVWQEVARLRAALQVYADEYEGNELAREVLGLPPTRRG